MLIRTSTIVGTARCCGVIYGLIFGISFFYEEGGSRILAAILATTNMAVIAADFLLVLRWKLKPIIDNPTVEDRDTLIAINTISMFFLYFGGLRKIDLKREYNNETAFLKEAGILIREARKYSPELESRVKNLIRRRDLALARSSINAEIEKRIRILGEKRELLKRAMAINCEGVILPLVQEDRIGEAHSALTRAKGLLESADRFGLRQEIAALVSEGEFDAATKNLELARQRREETALNEKLKTRIDRADADDKPNLERLMSALMQETYGTRAYRKIFYDLEQALEKADA